MSVGESTFDSFLQQLGDIDAAGDPQHGDGHGPGLGHVKQVVQQRLVLVRTETLEMVEDKQNWFTGGVSGFQ